MPAPMRKAPAAKRTKLVTHSSVLRRLSQIIVN